MKKFYEKNYKFYFNAGYYYIKNDIFKYLKKNSKSFELEILPILSKKNQVVISQLLTSWHPIDNKKDFNIAKRFFI